MATLATGLLHTVVLSSKVTSIISTVGIDLIIGTITTTTSSIINVIKYIATSIDFGVSGLISEILLLDLEFTLGIIDELVKEQQHKQLTESVKRALLGVSEILESINNELSIIKKEIDYHNTKYFNTWRKLSCQSNIETITKYNALLTHRCKMLFDLLKIYNNNINLRNEQ